MMLTAPAWLVLAIPLAAAVWWWRPPSRLLTVLRCLLLAAVVTAMCGPAVKLPSRAGTVVVVADRSLSMPPTAGEMQKEAVGLIQAKMSGSDRLAVVSFGRRPNVDLPPDGGKFGGFVTQVDPEGSDLAGALETALSLVPPDSPGRVLVLSDGRWTSRPPAGAAVRAAAREIGIDYRPIRRASANDLAVLRVDCPNTVTPGESFMVTAWVRSPVGQEVRYSLHRGETRLAAGKRGVPSGISRITFRDRAPATGVRGYRLEIDGADSDPVPENNRARLLVGTSGPKPMLCVSPSKASALVKLLAAGGIDVHAVTQDHRKWTLEELSQYSAVLLENTPAETIGREGMETLAAWVRQTGKGLMMTGGRQAYGPGGYFRSPLEAVMPVSMELRKEHRKLALAIVVALDRSGSMAASVGGGKTKMDLANLAAAEVVNLLSSMDEFGCVAVDSQPHVIVDLQAVENKGGIQSRIRKIDSMGGGIFVYEALTSAARMLVKAQAHTRHIILFADATDSEEPGKYQELLEQCGKANITVSVIGLGTDKDCDAGLLRDIAARGKGRCFFTNKPRELPRLFAQDTFVVARSAFLDELTPVRPTAGMAVLTGQRLTDVPPIGGYNLCYLRPRANLAMVSVDEYKAPVVAAWQAGTGRVLCYTGEADGKYAGPIARWKDAGHFFTSLGKWTTSLSRPLPAEMLLTQEVTGGVCKVQLHLDPRRKVLPFARMPKAIALRGLPGRPPATVTAEMQWSSADTLTAHIPLAGSETLLCSVAIGETGQFSLPPVCLPYSPEFEPADAGKPAATLEDLARATGGIERVNLGAIWGDLPARPRSVDLAPWLLIAATLLLLLEVFDRRTGLLSAVRVPRRRAAASEPPAVEKPAARGPRRQETPLQPAAAPKAEPHPPAPDIGDAFLQARRRARRRTDRGKS